MTLAEWECAYQQFMRDEKHEPTELKVSPCLYAEMCVHMESMTRAWAGSDRAPMAAMMYNNTKVVEDPDTYWFRFV